MQRTPGIDKGAGVAMYPFVGDRERDAALARITARHQQRDSRWSEAGADGDDPARDVLDYLRRRHTELRRDIAQDDVLDELVLAAWVWWDERRREQALLRRATSYGHSLGELGAFLGLTTRQATYEYRDRLDALLEAHRGDQDRQHHVAQRRAAAQEDADDVARDPEAIAGPDGLAVLPAAQDLYRRTRGHRPADVHAGAREHQQRRRDRRALPSAERWITEHHDQIHDVVTALLTQTARVGIAAAEQESDELTLEDLLAELAEEHDQARDGGRYGSATFARLGLVLGELRHHPAITALARNHGIHQGLAAADRLRARYAALERT